FEPGRPYLFQTPKHGRHANLSSGSLQVVDLRGDPRLSGDSKDLLEALLDVVPLRALVRDVAAAVASRGSRERDDLLRRGEAVRNVSERGRKAEGPLLHRLRDGRFYLCELFWRRAAILLPDDKIANAPRPDERPEVDGRPRPLECPKIFCERRPSRNNAVVRPEVAAVLDDSGVQRRNRRSFAGQLRRDALSDLARRPVVDEQEILRLPEHVDE